MSLELHNFTWEEVRLVQVETQPHHLAGVLAEVRDTLENSDCKWEEIYSAGYDCEEDGTTTFYEGESAEAGNPGIWTYVVYDCKAGQEEVVTNLEINTFEPALKLRKIISEVIAAQEIKSPEKQVEVLNSIAQKNGIEPKILISSRTATLTPRQRSDFDEAARYVIEKNAELYRRLA